MMSALCRSVVLCSRVFLLQECRRARLNLFAQPHRYVRSGRGTNGVHGASPKQLFVQSSQQKIISATAFSLLFTGGAFATCAVWQYESFRSTFAGWARHAQRRLLPDQSRLRGYNRPIDALKAHWQALDGGRRLSAAIIAANLLVFCAWKLPRCQAAMLRLFVATTSSAKLPLVLSTFSHSSFIHLACNMFVLSSFLPAVVRDFGVQQTFAAYLSGGTIASLFGLVYKLSIRSAAASLGASGSILAILAMFCYQHPDARMQIIFIPGFVFSAQQGLIGVMAFDLAGMVFRWQIFDHAAHIGGAIFGLWYAARGSDLLWIRYREPFIKQYHKLRQSLSK